MHTICCLSTNNQSIYNIVGVVQIHSRTACWIWILPDNIAMKYFTTKQHSNDTFSRNSFRAHAISIPKLKILSLLSSNNTIIQRKPSCPCGGGCPRCRKSLGIQTKLKISDPGDTYEQEADRVAEQVMRMPENLAVGNQPSSVRKEDESVQAKEPENSASNSVPELETHIHNIKGGGQPLQGTIRTFFETRFNHDFSQVRIHTNAKASELSQAVNARAFTMGRDIVFNTGQYAPNTIAGRQLLAHELTHTIQQGGTHDFGYIFRQGRRSEETASTTVFDNESPELRKRRKAVIGWGNIVVDRLKNALSRGYIWRFEAVTSKGVTPLHTEIEESIPDREARLRQLIADLIHLINQLKMGPIPSGWLEPSAIIPGESITVGGQEQRETDLYMFYVYSALDLARSGDLVWNNVPYIMEAPNPTSAVVRRAPVSRGLNLGIFLIVPDPENAPQVYRLYTGYEGWWLKRSRGQERGVLVDAWEDDFGYFYYYKGERHYLPGHP